MRVNRRRFLAGSLAAAAGQLACADPVTSPTRLTQPPVVSGIQTAQVNIGQLAQAIRQQQCEEWCWAASISTIFNFYGHPLTQQEIVAATYGNVVCWPSNGSTNVAIDLSRTYVDNRGTRFSSRIVSAYDYYYGVNTFTNQSIINALNSNNPLLYANMSHAMVLYSVLYAPSAFGPNILACNVIDPWPLSPIMHGLSAAEMMEASFGGQMTFLAQVQLQ